MKRTLSDKVAYNDKKGKETGDPFAIYYGLGVIIYQQYPRNNGKYRTTVDATIKSFKRLSLTKDPYHVAAYKGLMCGLRDAANDRKSKRTPPSP